MFGVVHGSCVGALIVSVLGGAGCQPGDDPPTTPVGDLAVVSFERPLCGGDIATIEETILNAAEELDVALDAPIEIYLYNHYEDVVDRCGSGPSGCFTGGEIHTLWQSLEHEIVHAVAQPLGSPPAFWREGIAETLSDRTRRGSQDVGSQVVIENARELDYGTAGHFVRWLREEYGVSGMRALARESSFEDAYDRELAEAIEDYEANAPWSYPRWNPCVGARLDATAENRWDHDIEVGCDDPWGLAQYDSGPTVLRTIDVEEPGTYRLTVAGGHRIGATACQLDVIAEQPEDDKAGDIILESSGLDLPTFFVGDEPHEVRLETGRLQFSITVEGAAGTVGFVLERVGS